MQPGGRALHQLVEELEAGVDVLHLMGHLLEETHTL